ncbi:hypothetical protein ACS15_0957 [Ralstonia insidiosa]|uniref:DUF2957 domain-containing protein n=1 Tax=Ralstonia insidiosa TaxID=190721 RepID=A0AAC9FT07_9RALS|nr:MULTISPECIES: DUF2957 domain-containing protein [Ralstonia]ANH74972.1 hypothetical protein ACS15_0957 [Ralstonia insidiosa]MBY4703544.1 DUF2957 domain-containing protein [Ralstonia insidiosa]
MGSRRHLFVVMATSCMVAMPFIGGCGGADDPGSSNVAQCSGSSCPPSGPNTTPTTPTSLCPAALDYTTTYTGGSGSGEYIKVKFDTSKNTYQMQFIESSVPTSAGQVNNTRKGLTINGTFVHPTNLPTPEQNRCAFVLQSGKTADNSYAITVNPQDPPTLFVGQGIVGGGIPGATIQFNGIQPLPGLVIGAVPSRSFDFYPFLGFSETVTDFTQVAGHYNEVGVHVTPTGSGNQTTGPQGWEPDAVNWTQTLNADGTCTAEGIDYSCHTTGTPWTRRLNADGSQDNVFVSNPTAANVPYAYVGQVSPLVLPLASNQAKGILIAGKLNGQVVPVVIRVGYVHVDSNLLATSADDQIGISILTPVATIPANALAGGYIGATSASACGLVTSNGPSGFPASLNGLGSAVDHPELSGSFTGGTFHTWVGNCTDGTAVSTLAANYTSTLFQNGTAAFINPFNSRVTAQFTLDYTQTSPGKLLVTAQNDFNAQGASGNVALFKAGDKGVAVRVGNVYAMLMNNNKFNPFFTVGAFVQ